MKYILGKKLNMTQIFKEDGAVVPVTKIQAGPCTVVQVKTEDKDGYMAVQFGYGERKEKNVAKPQRGHIKGLQNFRYLREMRISRIAAASKAPRRGGQANGGKNSSRVQSSAPGRAGEVELKRGDKIDVSIFKKGDMVEVVSVSKGKGFQGVVKRHGFHGSPASHGHKDQLRMPGSIGATGPAHVFKGVRMPGHMGSKRVTVKNLKIVGVDADKDVMYVKGAVPGARNGLILIQGKGEIKIAGKDKGDKEESKK